MTDGQALFGDFSSFYGSTGSRSRVPSYRSQGGLNSAVEAGMQPHLLANLLGQIWMKFGQVLVKFG